MTSEELTFQEKVNSGTNFFLHSVKRNLPIKKSDFMMTVLPDSKQLYSAVFPKVKEKLKKVFGLRLHEVVVSGQKHFVVTNQFSGINIPKEALRMNDNEATDLGILFIVLLSIFMLGGSLKKGVLIEILELYLPENISSNEFETIKKKVFTDFTKQLYLNVVNDGTDEFICSWGVRADLELSKLHILEFACEVLSAEASSFSSQLREARECALDINASD